MAMPVEQASGPWPLHVAAPAGAWTASVWLTTAEAERTPTAKKKTLAATSRDTVRSRRRTGKPARRLRSARTDGWHGESIRCRCRCKASSAGRRWPRSTS